jgi:hypothetical protein
MQTTKKQNVIAVSANMKQFVEDEAVSFSAPNKGGDITNATNREIADAMHRFVDKTRYVKRDFPVMMEETDEDGNSVFVDSGEVESREVDAFGEFVSEVLAERLDNVRVNTQAAKLKSQEEELAALRAQLALLTAAPVGE